LLYVVGFRDPESTSINQSKLEKPRLRDLGFLFLINLVITKL